MPVAESQGGEERLTQDPDINECPGHAPKAGIRCTHTYDIIRVHTVPQLISVTPPKNPTTDRI